MVRVLIIGGGIAGIHVLQELLSRRKEIEDAAADSKLEITLLKKERSGWLSTCGLPFALQGIYDIETTEITKAEEFLKQGVDFRTQTEAVELNTDEKSVRLRSGEELRYDFLVIATGRTPVLPKAVEDAMNNVKRVHTFSNEEDAEQIYASMRDAKNGFVRGRGIIALQTAVAFAKRGIKTTVLGGPPSLLPSMLDADMGDILKEYLERNYDIRFILERKEIKALNADAEGNVRSVLVEGADGEEEEIPADVVVIARGFRPNTELARSAGIETGESGGIITDKAMHVRKKGRFLRDAFALGDCVEVVDAITHKRRLAQLASTALVQARVIADNIVSEISGEVRAYSTYEPCISPTVAAIGGMLVGSVGITSEEARRNGIKVIAGKAQKVSKARYFPGAEKINAKLLFDAHSERLLGAQIVSSAEGVAERINELSLAIKFGMTAKEICMNERCYDPSLALLKDVFVDAAENALKA
ncbi:MAG: FAD-dependent oxidoreductase [Candidatus Methanospirare jalkutatii]|nr:FAD-dependent oxidoreductase [Candidatus Methanospirare jalkutatii]